MGAAASVEEIVLANKFGHIALFSDLAEQDPETMKATIESLDQDQRQSMLAELRAAVRDDRAACEENTGARGQLVRRGCSCCWSSPCCIF